MKATKEEKDFQTVANEYAQRVIAGMREELEALEHASECSGEVDCDRCAGTGNITMAKKETECPVCEGTGLMKCDAGKDSDDPEAWHDEERARRRIEEGPLSVEVRSGWYTPGAEPSEIEPEEYNILLGTGGPAARIIGDLDRGEATSATFQYQDWFKPWTDAQLDSADEEVLLDWAQHQYLGS